MDPVLSHIVSGGLGLLFLTAGVQKLRNRQDFLQALSGYKLVPEKLLSLATLVIPVLELSIAVTVLISPLAAVAATVLLLIYASAMGINIQRGNLALDCGCQLGRARQAISGALVIRNVVLTCVSLTLLVPVVDRPMAAYDYGATGFGLVMAVLLYASSNMLIANATSYREINS